MIAKQISKGNENMRLKKKRFFFFAYDLVKIISPKLPLCKGPGGL